MTMRITMLTTVMGEAGSLLTSGTTYTVSDGFGAAMVGQSKATDTDGVLRSKLVGVAQFQFPDSQEIVDMRGRSIGVVTAIKSNPPLVRDEFLIAPPAWVATTQYFWGNWVSNGGNWYACIGNGNGTGDGTSAGAGGPTGTGSAQIVDGTAVWYYMGPVTLASSSAVAPTVTSTSSLPGALTNTRIEYNSGKIGYGGGQPVVSLAGNAYMMPAWSVSAVSSGNTSVGGSTNGGFRWGVMTDSRYVTFANVGLTTVSIYVRDADDPSGRFLRLFPQGFTAINNNPGFLNIDFTPCNGGGRKMREVIVECWRSPSIASLRGVYVENPTLDTVMPAPSLNAPRLRAAFVGSSYTGGSNEGPPAARLYWHGIASNLLGIDDTWNMGSGGTGFVAANGGNSYSVEQRLALDLARASRWEMIVLEGLNNDPDTSATDAAVARCIQIARTAAPNALIVVMGVIGKTSGPNAASLSLEARGLAGFNAAADGNSVFIRCATDPEGAWNTGTGRVGATAGNGNSDNYISEDNVHYNPRGDAYIAGRFVKALRAAL